MYNGVMMITYSTNWMGPVNMDWYRKRGLTKTVTKILEEDSKYSDKKKGDILTYDDITEHWAGGRIDVYGTGQPYGDELGLDIMHGEDYRLFSDWLDGFKTDTMWTLEQLVQEYEQTNPKIRWAEDVFKDIE